MHPEAEVTYRFAYQYTLKIGDLNKKMLKAQELLDNSNLELKSVIAFVTSEMENKGVAKTIIKDKMSGDPRVISQTKIVQESHRNVKALNASIELMESRHSLEKKKLSVIIAETQHIGPTT